MVDRTTGLGQTRKQHGRAADCSSSSNSAGHTAIRQDAGTSRGVAHAKVL